MDSIERDHAEIQNTSGLAAGGAALIITTVYMVVRSVIYAHYPAQSLIDWARRDTLMDVPRLLCAFAALLYGVRRWGWRRFGFHANGARTALVWGLLAVGLYAIDFLTYQNNFKLPACEFFLFVLSSFIVGFFEEILFRGLWLKVLGGWRSPFCAAWVSSLIFTVYHYQAQAMYGWPVIFFTGLLWAYMRLAGVSLWWLMLIHGAVDALVIFVGKADPQLVVSWAIFYNGVWAVLAATFFILSRRHHGTQID